MSVMMSRTRSTGTGRRCAVPSAQCPVPSAQSCSYWSHFCCPLLPSASPLCRWTAGCRTPGRRWPREAQCPSSPAGSCCASRPPSSSSCARGRWSCCSCSPPGPTGLGHGAPAADSLLAPLPRRPGRRGRSGGEWQACFQRWGRLHAGAWHPTNIILLGGMASPTPPSWLMSITHVDHPRQSPCEFGGGQRCRTTEGLMPLTGRWSDSLQGPESSKGSYMDGPRPLMFGVHLNWT
jgi:hypothetical protein